MKKRWLKVTLTIALSTTTLFVLLGLMKENRNSLSTQVLAASTNWETTASTPTTPTVMAVDPSMNPNDIDTPVVIQGSNFTATISGTVILTTPTAYLGDQALMEVVWVNSTTLSATVPWGLDPGVYTLTVVNPDGGFGRLEDAFTATQGLDVWTTNGPYGGHVSQVRINPQRPETVYAVAQGMGMLVSTDGAASWKPMLFNLNPPEQICVDAGNPDVLYAGGGSPWRSSDGGSTWEILTVHPPVPFIGRNYRLAADPSQAGVVYAIASDSSPPGLTGGILRSESYGDTGTWITLTQGVSDTNFIRLAVHPTYSDTLLAGTQNGNLFYTLDGGQNWTHTHQLTHPVHGLYFNPYASLEAWAVGDDKTELYKSTDLMTWTPVEIDPGHMWAANDFDMAFLSDTIWVSNWNVYSSTNHGEDWTGMGVGQGSVSIAAHPDRPLEIYTGDFTHGVFKSADGGQSWQSASDGLAGLNPSAVVVAPDDPETVYAKVDISLIKSENGGQTWRSLEFGQGGFPDRTKLAIDPFQPERLYFGHGCQNSVCLWITDDGGEDPGNWISVTAALPVTYSGWNGAFYTLAPHPDVPDRILAGLPVWPPDTNFWDDQTEALLFASDDDGLTWEHLGPTQPISWVTEIAFDSQDSDLIYAATNGTGLWKSTDGGQSWQRTPDPSGFADISLVAAHPNIASAVYVHASEEGSEDNGGLFVSYDAGETWTHLTWQAGSQLLFVPTHPPTLLTGCGWGDEFGGGVCQSRDDGETWSQVAGISFATAMAASTDGERVMTYIGTPGGMVSGGGSQTVNLMRSAATNEEYSAIGAGVYRLTTVLPTNWVYLPLVLSGHAP
jgi:photosystem II stability/assembly factor-like uncharacterized protein